jgi:hypothetical protein
MKKILYVAVFSAAVLAGCAKDDSNQPASVSDGQNVVTTSSDLHGFTIDERLGLVKSKSISSSELNFSNYYSTGEGVNSATGMFGNPPESHYTFSVNDNNGNVTGHVNLSGPSFAFAMSSTCLQIMNGNDAIIAGQISAVTNDGGFPDFIKVGNYIFFRVVDNGEGSNAPNDWLYDDLWVNFTPVCGFDLFTVPWSTYSEIEKNGNIQVK